MAPHIANLGQWRAAVLGGLRRAAQARADAGMLALHDELAAYPCGDPVDQLTPEAAVHVPFRLRVGEREPSFLAIIATFGTALDITLSELAIESCFPRTRRPRPTYANARADGPTAAPVSRESRRRRRPELA